MLAVLESLAAPAQGVPAVPLQPMGQQVQPLPTTQLKNATLPAPTTGTPKCNYFPSTVEQAWMEAPAAGKICEIAKRPKQVAAARLWLSYAARAKGTHNAAAPLPTPEEAAILSRYECQLANGETTVEYIEPLTGVARHPFAKVGCNFDEIGEPDVDIFDLSYLVLQDGCATGSAPGNRLLFDLGCASWTAGPAEQLKIDRGEGTGRGPSMPLFAKLYEDRCLDLTGIHGWEARHYDPVEWWSKVSPADKQRIHFNNKPITEDEGPDSFSYNLKLNAVPSDFVAVKVDIDYVPVEHPIVNDIADRPELTELVDELFFEYHFWFDDLNFGWNSQRGGKMFVNDTVDDALSLMSKLRHKGVRAHWWI